MILVIKGPQNGSLDLEITMTNLGFQTLLKFLSTFILSNYFAGTKLFCQLQWLKSREIGRALREKAIENTSYKKARLLV
jgi:hypothetical protein